MSVKWQVEDEIHAKLVKIWNIWETVIKCKYTRNSKRIYYNSVLTSRDDKNKKIVDVAAAVQSLQNENLRFLLRVNFAVLLFDCISNSNTTNEWCKCRLGRSC